MRIGGAFNTMAFAITSCAAVFVARRANRLVIDAAEPVCKTTRFAAIADGSRAFGVVLAGDKRAALSALAAGPGCAALPAAAHAPAHAAHAPRACGGRGGRERPAWLGDAALVDIGDEATAGEAEERGEKDPRALL